MRYSDADGIGFERRVAAESLAKAELLLERRDVDGALGALAAWTAGHRSTEDDDLRTRFAEMLQLRARALHDAGRLEEALQANTELIGTFLDDLPGEQWLVGLVALSRQSELLAALGRRADAIAAVDQLRQRYGEVRDTAARVFVANALGRQSALWAELGDSAQEERVIQELLTRYGDAPEPALRSAVAEARRVRALRATSPSDPVAAEATRELERGFHLLGRQELEAGLGAFDRVLRRLAGATDSRLRQLAVRAFRGRAQALALLDRPGEALAAQDAVFNFGEDALAVFAVDERKAMHTNDREGVAVALLNQMVVLGTLGQRRSALATAEALIARFDKDSSATIVGIVAQARASQAALRAGS